MFKAYCCIIDKVVEAENKEAREQEVRKIMEKQNTFTNPTEKVKKKAVILHNKSN